MSGKITQKYTARDTNYDEKSLITLVPGRVKGEELEEIASETFPARQTSLPPFVLAVQKLGRRTKISASPWNHPGQNNRDVRDP